MTNDEIASLRADFPTLLTPSSTIDEDIPSAWLPAVRSMLTEYVRVQSGTLYRDQGPVDLHVRALVIRKPRHALQHPYLLDVTLHAPHARGALKKSLRWPLASARMQIERLQREQRKADPLGYDPDDPDHAGRVAREALSGDHEPEVREEIDGALRRWGMKPRNSGK